MGVDGECHVGGRCRVEGVPQHDLLGGGGEQFFAPEHVRDGHGPVVDRVGQDEERHAVTLDADEVLGGPVGELDLAPDQVDHGGAALVGCPEAQGAAVTPGKPEVAAMTVVARGRVTGRRPCLGPRLDLVPGATTGVQRAAAPESLDGRLVGWALGRLEVRALIGGHAQPLQGGDDAIGPFGAVALFVGVLDPQDERAAALAREQPVEQGGAGTSDVEEAGGRGREAQTWNRKGRGVSHGWPGYNYSTLLGAASVTSSVVLGNGDRTRRAAVHGFAQLLAHRLRRVFVEDVEVPVVAHLEDLGQDAHTDGVAGTLVEVHDDLHNRPPGHLVARAYRPGHLIQGLSTPTTHMAKNWEPPP